MAIEHSSSGRLPRNRHHLLSWGLRVSGGLGALYEHAIPHPSPAVSPESSLPIITGRNPEKADGHFFVKPGQGTFSGKKSLPAGELDLFLTPTDAEHPVALEIRPNQPFDMPRFAQELAQAYRWEMSQLFSPYQEYDLEKVMLCPDGKYALWWKNPQAQEKKHLIQLLNLSHKESSEIVLTPHARISNVYASDLGTFVTLLKDASHRQYVQLISCQGEILDEVELRGGQFYSERVTVNHGFLLAYLAVEPTIDDNSQNDAFIWRVFDLSQGQFTPVNQGTSFGYYRFEIEEGVVPYQESQTLLLDLIFLLMIILPSLSPLWHLLLSHHPHQSPATSSTPSDRG